MKDIIAGFKSLGIIFNEVLTNTLKSFETTHEEDTFKEESLEDKWKRELHYYSDERLEEELRRCSLYNWSIEYDGRYKCIDKLAEFKARNGYKVC